MTYQRVGPMSPLELQLRRVRTRSEFLLLEVEKLAELVDAGARLSDDQAAAVADPLERVGALIVRLVSRHAVRA